MPMRVDKYTKQSEKSKHREFCKWCMAFNYLGLKVLYIFEIVLQFYCREVTETHSVSQTEVTGTFSGVRVPGN